MLDVEAVLMDREAIAVFNDGRSIDIASLSATHPVLAELGASDIWMLAIIHAQMM